MIKAIIDEILGFMSIIFAPVIIVVFLIGGFFVTLWWAIEDIRAENRG